jgi:hypothetical protein
MPTTIAVINTYPKFDAVFDPVALEMRMAVRKYPGIRPMADDLNAKTLPAEDLALIDTSPTPALPLNKGEGAGGGRGIIKRLGLSPEECLARAGTMFREMDLQWDLAELEKVREKMP